VFFQAREVANQFYDACSGIVELLMGDFAQRTGRRYGLFEYVGDPEAERVIVIMAPVRRQYTRRLEYLAGRGGRWDSSRFASIDHFRECVYLGTPPSTKSIAVLDRTKEPGAPGDPLYLDVMTALGEARAEGESQFKTEPRVVAGRYGLSSKEFTPAMVKLYLTNWEGVSPSPFHDRHHRRCHAPVAPVGCYIPNRGRGCFRLALLRTWCRWHGRRKQELDQDYRPRD
jgi:pyruvate-ferredoxin/flavodoxin oxidoreductase